MALPVSFYASAGGWAMGALARLLQRGCGSKRGELVIREERMGLGGKLMWAVAGSAASKMARNYTRRSLHTSYGAPRLPRKARKQSGLGMMLGWAVLTGVIMALADVFKEQGKDTVRAR
jgi:hypothetical protein